MRCFGSGRRRVRGAVVVPAGVRVGCCATTNGRDTDQYVQAARDDACSAGGFGAMVVSLDSWGGKILSMNICCRLSGPSPNIWPVSCMTPGSIS